jgi:endonuclease YncB( thermonuclease family)
MWMTVFLGLSLMVGAGAVAALPTLSVEGRAKIIDGDTLKIAGTAIRLLHIDAPESGQSCGATPCGAAATAHLAGLVGNGPVACNGTRIDTYGRLLAVCTSARRDLNRQMVLDGHAMVFRRYGDVYDQEEQQARSARRGIWATPETVAPWDYRAEKWTNSAQTAPRANCPIKGNITADGERIYHTPYSRWYDRTRISPARGERWFCDENEARTAGWRAARGS